MFKAKSLYHLIVYSIMFIIVLISFFTFIIISNAHEELQDKILTLKTDYSSSQKEIIKNDVNSAIKFINYYHSKYKKTKSTKKIKEEVLEALEKLRIGDNINEYLFRLECNFLKKTFSISYKSNYFF